MSHNLIKYFVLLLSLAGSAIAYLLFELKVIDVCDIYCSEATGYYHRSFIFFYFILLFSLITHFSPERVFQSWWKFARIAIPVVFGLALLINLELHHSPVGEFQNMFDAPALISLYSIFIVGSVWQIWKGWGSK